MVTRRKGEMVKMENTGERINLAGIFFRYVDGQLFNRFAFHTVDFSDVYKRQIQYTFYRSNQNSGELILDNNDLERERGITTVSYTHLPFIFFNISLLFAMTDCHS